MSEHVPNELLPTESIEEVDQGARYLIVALDKLHVAEYFGTPEASYSQLHQTSFYDYERQLFWANGVIRHITTQQRQRERLGYGGQILLPRDERCGPVSGLASTDILYCAPYRGDGRGLQAEAFTVALTLEDLHDSAMLLRLAGLLTHRSHNANGRANNLLYSLLTYGYDGSSEAKAHYAQLLKNGRGVETLGMGIDISILGRTYANYRMHQYREKTGYTGPMPTGTTQFVIRELFDTRPDLDYHRLMYVGLYFAEQHMNIPLLMEWMAVGHLPIDEYLITMDGATVVDMQQLFADMTDAQVTRAVSMHDKMKYDFVMSVINCYRGDASIYGDHHSLTAQLLAAGASPGKTHSSEV